MNKMCIIGNLTKDPELRTTTSGINVCSFTVAVNRRKKTKNGEELPPMFYRVTTWRQLAEFCSKFLKKGSKVYAEGDLSVSTYEGNDGSTRFSLDIDSSFVEFLSTKQDGAEKPQSPPPKKDEQTGFEQVKIDDDELPF